MGLIKNLTKLKISFTNDKYEESYFTPTIRNRRIIPNVFERCGLLFHSALKGQYKLEPPRKLENFRRRGSIVCRCNRLPFRLRQCIFRPEENRLLARRQRNELVFRRQYRNGFAHYNGQFRPAEFWRIQ